MSEYLYINPRIDGTSILTTDALSNTSERHHVVLNAGRTRPAADPHKADPLGAIDGHGSVEGVVISLSSGIPDRARLDIAATALKRGLRVWFYWPAEHAIECVDDEKLTSLRRHRLAVIALERLGRPVYLAIESWKRVRPGLRWMYRGVFRVHHDELMSELEGWSLNARPVPFRALFAPPTASSKISAGLYLRTDFWNQFSSGGSYGHTCYVAKELAATADRFACLLPQRYTLLDRLGVEQAIMDAPPNVVSEDGVVTASDHYYPRVKMACRLLRPEYIYERLCLGNWVAARLSRELQIPYLVEYNGSELSIRRTDDNTAPVYKDVYLKTEEIAFRQATVISVISEPVKADLVARGVDARKILVNPNGADLEGYAPAAPDEKRRLRRTLGFNDEDCVVGFTGTFGWWHGIDVLAAAIPRICAENPSVKFLLIGDGAYKPQLDDEVERQNLGDRVLRVGRVPQQEGAELLKACDIYVSPHSRHMVDSKFFGSPTKVFEYMAMAGGIVASDLEQIGEVLSPALRPSDLASADISVTNQRSVLCEPGNVDEFIAAVAGLARHPEIASALGRNARQAIVDHYSWYHHVGRLWTFAAALPRDSAVREVVTGDAYKEQVQNQWNNNPVGSETARSAQVHTLAWFEEVERYRYQVFAPWMPSVMEFAGQSGKQVLEVGGGLGTDLAQFAKNGALVTDVDLSAGHLQMAQDNFRLRGLNGRFVHHDAESLPFDDDTFDLVYSNGVIHHTPNTARMVREMWRVLKPGGRAIVMVYAENSLLYWRNLVWQGGLKNGDLATRSMGDIMSRTVERGGNDARPLVKVYTRARLRALFRDFTDLEIVQRQISPELVPRPLRRLMPTVERLAGWNLIIKARKPRRP